jgi:hypothetical protein
MDGWPCGSQVKASWQVPSCTRFEVCEVSVPTAGGEALLDSPSLWTRTMIPKNQGDTHKQCSLKTGVGNSQGCVDSSWEALVIWRHFLWSLVCIPKSHSRTGTPHSLVNCPL